MGSMLKYLHLLLRIVVESSACERVLIAVHSKYHKKIKKCADNEVRVLF